LITSLRPIVSNAQEQERAKVLEIIRPMPVEQVLVGGTSDAFMPKANSVKESRKR